MRELHATLVGRHSLVKSDPITIAVADPERKIGASALTADLACASAKLGYRVLLVDANISRPSQHKLFQVRNDRGVSDIAQWAPLGEDGIVETAIRGLSLLPAGPYVPDTAETIERLELCERLRRIGRNFDTILVDVTAQDLPEAAAAAIGSHGVLLAVRRDRTPIQVIRRAVAALSDRNVAILGMVPLG
jgi:Mrp family chromosome partitioning ATPase